MADEPKTPNPTPPTSVTIIDGEPPPRGASAEDVAGLASQLAEMEQARARLEAQNASLSERLDLVDAGLTDVEAHDVARALWSRQGGEDRPPLTEWVRAQVADPTTAARGLRPYLAGSQAPASAPAPAGDTSPPAAGVEGGRPPATPTGQSSQGPATPTDAATRVANLTAQLRAARQTGNTSAVADLSGELVKAMAARRAESMRIG